MSLDLGALVGSVILETTTFDRAYARVVAQFSQLGVQAEKSAAGITPLDESMDNLGKNATVASAGLDRVSKSNTTTSTSADKAAAAAERHAAAVARVTGALTANTDASAKLQAAQLRQVAAQDRLDTVMGSGAATASRLAAAQAAVISATARTTAIQGEAAAAQAAAWDKSAAKFAGYASTVSKATIGLGVVIAAESIKAAASFQSQITLLETAGGETAANLKTVSAGILQLAVSTGTSTSQLAAGMYIVEKAGDRGAAGLKVLGAAAQGAKAEAVPLATAVNALTSVLMSYHLSTADAVSVQNELIAGSGMAKTTMTEYAASLSTVIPIASAAGISFAQVAGAIATLTQHGTSAQEATQELAGTIRNLQAPNQVAIKAMQQLGINVTDLETHLGTRGLTGTIQLVTDAIASKLGPQGTVLVDTMMKSQTATADLQVMLGKMPASLRTLAQGFLDGQVSMKDYRVGIRDLGASGYAQGTQFLSLATQVKGYNAQIKAGGPAAQTAAAALKNIMGGAQGLNTALMLGGENMAYFNTATKAVAAAGKQTGANISTWAKTQATLSVQLDKAREMVQVLAIQIGTKLIPIVTTIVGWLTKHQTVVLEVIIGLAALATTVTVVTGAFWLFTAASTAVSIGAALLTGNMIALDAAMDANPVGAITLALLALGAGVYELVTHFQTVVKFLNGPWGTAISAAVAVFMPFIGLPMLMIGHWELVKQLASDLVNWLSPVVDFIRSLFIVQFHAAVAVVDALADTPHALMTAWSAVSGFFVRIASDISGALTTAWTSILNGGKTVLAFFTALPGQVLGAFRSAGTWLLGVGKDIAVGLLNGFYDWWVQWPRDVYRWIVTNGGLIGIGARLLSDMLTGLAIGWHAVAAFFAALPGRIRAYLASAATWLHSAGSALLSGFLLGVTTAAKDLWGWLSRLPGTILGYLRTAGSWLRNTGVLMLHGFVAGIDAGASTLWSFLSSLPGRILSYLKGAASWLVSTGHAVIIGFLRGVDDGFQYVVNFFSHLASFVVGEIGDASKWLYQVGVAMIEGMVHGIESAAGDVAKAVEGAASKAVGGVKHLLGIKSPSTVMRDQVGVQIPAGIAAGMVRNAGVIDQANKHLANRIAGVKMATGAPLNLPSAASYRSVPSHPASQPTFRMPDVYVVNPWTGEVLLAKTADVADARIEANNEALAR